MSEQLPDYYGEVFNIMTTPWGASITFGVGPHKPKEEGHDVCVVRLSHETAKSLAMLLRKQLKVYERETHTSIALPLDVMNQLGMSQEDW